jgi:hypothetical protein
MGNQASGGDDMGVSIQYSIKLRARLEIQKYPNKNNVNGFWIPARLRDKVKCSVAPSAIHHLINLNSLRSHTPVPASILAANCQLMHGMHIYHNSLRFRNSQRRAIKTYNATKIRFRI